MKSPTLPKPKLKLPTLANPRLMIGVWLSAVPADNNPDSCVPTLPMPETIACVPRGSVLVLYNPDTPEPKFSAPEFSEPKLAIARARPRHRAVRLVPKTRHARTEVPETRPPTRTGVEETRRRGGGRISKARRRRHINALSRDGTDIDAGRQGQRDAINRDRRGAKAVNLTVNIDRQRK